MSVIEQTNKDAILKEAEALIEENTIESAQCAVQKLATLKGDEEANKLLDKEYDTLQKSVEYQNSRLGELDDALEEMESRFKKIKIWKKIFAIDILLMIISALLSRLIIYKFYVDEPLVLGAIVLGGNFLVLTLLIVSFIQIYICNTKFGALCGKSINFFADKSYFSKTIHNTEIEILNVQKYIISAELLLKEIEKIKSK